MWISVWITFGDNFEVGGHQRGGTLQSNRTVTLRMDATPSSADIHHLLQVFGVELVGQLGLRRSNRKVGIGQLIHDLPLGCIRSWVPGALLRRASHRQMPTRVAPVGSCSAG